MSGEKLCHPDRSGGTCSFLPVAGISRVRENIQSVIAMKTNGSLSHSQTRRSSIHSTAKPCTEPVLGLTFMNNLERIPIRVKHIGGVVSRIVFHSCPR